MRIALFVAQAMQHFLHVLAAIVEQRRRRAADPALMVDERRLDAAVAVKLARIAFAVRNRLHVRIALRAGHVVIDPRGIEKFHQRPVQRIDPDHRLVGIVAVIVPGPVRGQDEIAAVRGAALAFDDGVAAFVRQNGSAGIRRMQMDRRDVARIVDRDGAADRVSHLQAPVQSGIKQKDALPVGEFNRGDVGFAGDFGDLLQVTAVFAPLPHMRKGLHLIDGDAAGAELSRTFAAGFAEPRPLRRRIGLGAHPDIVLAGFAVDGLHQLARLVRKPARGRSFHCHGSHEVVSLRGDRIPDVKRQIQRIGQN